MWSSSKNKNEFNFNNFIIDIKKTKGHNFKLVVGAKKG
jgi:hypothetical protein